MTQSTKSKTVESVFRLNRFCVGFVSFVEMSRLNQTVCCAGLFVYQIALLRFQMSSVLSAF